MTLRFRLALFTSLLIVGILSLVAISVYLLTERSLESGVEERARQALADLSQGVVATGLQRLPGDVYFQILIIGPAPLHPADVRSIRSGLDYLESAPLRANPTPESLVDLLSDRTVAQLVLGDALDGHALLASGERLRVLGSVETLRFPAQLSALTAVILVGVPTSNVRATLDQLATDLALTVLAALAAFALLVWWLARSVLSPLQRVTAAAARVTGSDLRRRVPVPPSHDEVRALATTINHMLARLEESFDTQRRFTTDASHELRTPVTAIVGHARYLLRRTSPTAMQIDSLHVIEREAERMAKLVHDLLELARADAGFTVTREAMNLLDVLEGVRDAYLPLVAPRELVIHSPEPLVEVDGDPERLKQVMLNLIQNAFEAGAQRVTATLGREGERVVVEILDDGPGIPAEHLPHLFERFYRVDNARSSTRGSGLGLSIVRWIVAQHGGDVQVESRVGEGTLFRITLPALAQRAT
jgi:two-component system, OmpR family, sensor kinase